MFFNNRAERVAQFGKKETLTPEQALQKLFESNDEIAAVLDAYLQKEHEIHTQAEIVGDGYTREDEYIRTVNRRETIRKLSELGVEVREETLYEFLKNN